jgi:hypothetical protein
MSIIPGVYVRLQRQPDDLESWPARKVLNHGDTGGKELLKVFLRVLPVSVVNFRVQHLRST